MVTSPAPAAAAPAAAVGAVRERAAIHRLEPADPPTGPTLTRTKPHATAMLFMKAGRPHEPVAVPQVLLGPGELLVEVELATVCASDVHTAKGHRIEPAPAVLGHEAVGRVSAIGGIVPALDGIPLVPGDRVVWSVMAHCGACDRCERGQTQSCRSLRKYGHERIGQGWELTGGFATHVHLREGTAIARVDSTIPAAVLAPAGCGVSTAWAALAAAERSGPLRGATVLVTGAGLIGLAATAMATERGATVIVSEPDAERRALARRFGAVAVVDPFAGDAASAALATLTAGARAGASHARPEVDVAIEASGSPLAVAHTIDALGPASTVVLVGSVFPTDPVPLVPERVVRSQLTITGVHNYTPDHLAEAVAFLGANWRTYPFEQLVGQVYPLTDLDSALARAALQAEVRVGVSPVASRVAR